MKRQNAVRMRFSNFNGFGGRGSRIRTCDLKYPKFEKRVSPCFPVKELSLISLAFWLPLVLAATPCFRSGGHRVVTAVPA